MQTEVSLFPHDIAETIRLSAAPAALLAAIAARFTTMIALLLVGLVLLTMKISRPRIGHLRH
ncbi:hypothetical protein [Pseudodonghicola xiamenensis]|uniref:Uncharacterized protein n=1 Tax=Pseudodonghicola xiamenensis TaxID=337702 RepID=A0A8J3MBJ2_9RHOB|nr:hypothetical protein [Pseudodonghicola xiamenensis]GHG80489.1 hypothetical protein GCM10010961_03670 [Pseudodonghicola xiamenensis]